MFKIIYINLFISVVFAANLTTDYKIGQPHQVMKQKDNTNYNTIGADEPIPEGLSFDIWAVELPIDTFNVEVYIEDQIEFNTTQELETQTKMTQPIDKILNIEKEVQLIDGKPNLKLNKSYIMNDPELIINKEVVTPAVRPTQTTKVSSAPINSTTIHSNVTTNETKLEKSFLEKLEQKLGITSGGSAQTVLASTTIMVVVSAHFAFIQI